MIHGDGTSPALMLFQFRVLGASEMPAVWTCGRRWTSYWPECGITTWTYLFVQQVHAVSLLWAGHRRTEVKHPERPCWPGALRPGHQVARGPGGGGTSACQLCSYITCQSTDLLKAKIMSSYLLPGLSLNPEGARHPETAHMQQLDRYGGS